MFRVFLALCLVLMAGAAVPAASAPPKDSNLKTSIFAGGCFWSAEHEMEKVRGVVDVVVGYSGGAKRNPTYENHEGHLEAIRVTWDPSRTTYPALSQPSSGTSIPPIPTARSATSAPATGQRSLWRPMPRSASLNRSRPTSPARSGGPTPPGSFRVRPSGWVRATTRTTRSRIPPTTTATASAAVATRGSGPSGRDGAEGSRANGRP